MGRMLGAVGPSERRYWPLTRSADGPSLSRCAGGTWLPAQIGEASGTQRAAMDLANEFFFLFFQSQAGERIRKCSHKNGVGARESDPDHRHSFIYPLIR